MDGSIYRTSHTTKELRVGIDLTLVFAVTALMLMGLIVIASAGEVAAAETSGSIQRIPHEGLRNWLTQNLWFWHVGKQLLGLFLGAAGGMVILLVPRARLVSWAYPAFFIAIGLMLLVNSPLGVSVNGATRWIDLGVMRLQPSEFAKVAFVWGVAKFLGTNEGKLQDDSSVVLLAFVGWMMMVGPVMLQSDLGTTVVITGLLAVALFVAGLAMEWMVAFMLLAGLLVLVMIAMEPYRLARILSAFDPWSDADGAGYQIIQGWAAIAEGGFWGRGLGAGWGPRNVPEAHTDMIMSIVGEELGSVGWVLVLGLFLTLLWRGIDIARHGRTLFDVLMAGGMTVLLAAQAFINLGVVGGILPNKGLVLPFLSYGASAAIAHTFAIAVLLRIGLENHRAIEASDAMLGGDEPPRWSA